jgi:hypothetical protein
MERRVNSGRSLIPRPSPGAFRTRTKLRWGEATVHDAEEYQNPAWVKARHVARFCGILVLRDDILCRRS